MTHIALSWSSVELMAGIRAVAGSTSRYPELMIQYYTVNRAAPIGSHTNRMLCICTALQSVLSGTKITELLYYIVL